MSCKLGDKCDNVFACNILRPNVELLGCNFYKPKKPMTNEEYLKSCDTEQLAEWIYQLSVMDRIDQPWYFTPIRGSQKIVEWLKQPHGGES